MTADERKRQKNTANDGKNNRQQMTNDIPQITADERWDTTNDSRRQKKYNKLQAWQDGKNKQMTADDIWD